MSMQESETMKYIEYMESLYKTWCPYCDETNIHSNGNEQDLSSCDIDVVTCKQCGKDYGLGPEKSYE